MDESTWKKALDLIKQEVSQQNFKFWFSPTKFHNTTEEVLTLSVPSAFVKETLQKRFSDLLTNTVIQLVGQPLKIEYVVISRAVEEDEGEESEDLFQPQYQPTPQASPINPKFTLENFVVGLSNNVAYAAAQAVAQNPGTSYNPLFIYGGTGVGKTHLMLGIGNAILKKNPYAKVIYCSSEKFTNDYVEAIQTRKMGDLRNKYRSVDILLVDDVQFFSGREQTQEEFFHTFNELMAKNSQIILTSDRPPGEMPKLEDRLKSRFQGGLMVDIQQPDFDTRVAILKSKASEKGEAIPDESLAIIAGAADINTRELEGKLVQIIQILKTQNLPPTEENIRKILGQRPATTTLQNLNPKQILSAICSHFNIKLSELTGPKRNKELVLPRHMAMHILSEDLKMTVEKIGQVMGGRDHTTVMHGRDRIRGLINTDREVQRVFIELKQSLSASN